jgi:hypothetical protein
MWEVFGLAFQTLLSTEHFLHLMGGVLLARISHREFAAEVGRRHFGTGGLRARTT